MNTSTYENAPLAVTSEASYEKQVVGKSGCNTETTIDLGQIVRRVEFLVHAWFTLAWLALGAVAVLALLPIWG